MQLYNIDTFKGGWFIGNFLPSVFHTDKFEVCYRTHTKGEAWPVHYHKLGSEYTLLIRGKMRMNEKIIEAGTLLVIDPYEIADPEFLEDCELFIVKVPSIPGDKYEVNSPPR